MIGFGTFHYGKPVCCKTCGHYFAGATLHLKSKEVPACPSCGATTLKIASWDDVVISPKSQA